MNLNELVERKVFLNTCLMGYQMWNTYGKTPEELGAAMMADIERRRELHQVEKQIDDYIKGES